MKATAHHCGLNSLYAWSKSRLKVLEKQYIEKQDPSKRFSTHCGFLDLRHLSFDYIFANPIPSSKNIRDP